MHKSTNINYLEYSSLILVLYFQIIHNLFLLIFSIIIALFYNKKVIKSQTRSIIEEVKMKKRKLEKGSKEKEGIKWESNIKLIQTIYESVFGASISDINIKEGVLL